MSSNWEFHTGRGLCTNCISKHVEYAGGALTPYDDGAEGLEHQYKTGKTNAAYQLSLSPKLSSKTKEPRVSVLSKEDLGTSSTLTKVLNTVPSGAVDSCPDCDWQKYGKTS